jgi:hypothetical protein
LAAQLLTQFPGSIVADYNADVGATVLGGNITQWLNQAPGASATSKLAPSGSAPAYNTTDAGYNSHATVQWAGVAGTGLITQGAADSWTPTVSQAFTIYCVGQSDQSSGQVFVGGQFAVASNISYIAATVTQFQLFANTATVGAAATLTSPCVMAAIVNGASSSIYVNNSQSALATGNPGAATLTGLCLGTYEAGTLILKGKIARVLIFNAAHTANQLKTLFTDLGARYAIAVT